MNSKAKTVTIKDAILAKRLEAERERIRAENERKKSIYQTICALMETVEEAELLRHLSVLDKPSWYEVVEERFLARSCGYPLCAAVIEVDLRKKYTLLRRERKLIVPTDSEPVKFCSDRCMAMARAIAAQLDEIPGKTVVAPFGGAGGVASADHSRPKKFFIPNETDHWRPFLLESDEKTEETIENSTRTDSKKKFGVELVKTLHDLKLTDNEKEEEQHRGGGEEAGSDSEREEQEFLQQIRAFVTRKTKDEKTEGQQQTGWRRGFLKASQPTLAKSSSAAKSEENKSEVLLGEVVERVDRRMAEKGTTEGRLRAGGGGGTRRKPVMVEAPMMSRDNVHKTES